ncbi:hypothetical protein JJD41_14295 [Oxynema sp. CENA135]|nr:hypothetical protein [Oxynema sp. CENA135]
MECVSGRSRLTGAILTRQPPRLESLRDSRVDEIAWRHRVEGSCCAV